MPHRSRNPRRTAAHLVVVRRDDPLRGGGTLPTAQGHHPERQALHKEPAPGAT